MRYSNVAVVMVPLFAAVQCADLVYWVDKSCPIDIGLYIKDSISAAGLAYTHAGDMSDSAFDAVYQIIFKDHRSGATYNKVRSILGEIGGKTTTNKWSVVFDPTKREASDIRLYCDDDARWVQTTPGHWEDKDNQMTLNSQPDCQHTEAGGITYLNRVTPSTQNPKRVVTTLCNFAFTNSKAVKEDDPNSHQKFADYPATYDFSQAKGIDLELDHLIGNVLLHEWTHYSAYDLEDVGGQTAYTWENAIAKSAADAAKNAENYMYLGLWALLADRKFTLTPQPPASATAAQKTQAQADIKAGKIVRYAPRARRGVEFSA